MPKDGMMTKLNQHLLECCDANYMCVSVWLCICMLDCMAVYVYVCVSAR